jgi:hypothetical protein
MRLQQPDHGLVPVLCGLVPSLGCPRQRRPSTVVLGVLIIMFVLSRQALTHRNLILQSREVFLHCLLSRLEPLKLGGSSVMTFLERIHSKLDVQLNLQEVLHKPPRGFIAHSWTGITKNSASET